MSAGHRRAALRGAGHPNAHLYESLRSLVQTFNGYFLEADPCLICSDCDLVPYAARAPAWGGRRPDSCQLNGMIFGMFCDRMGGFAGGWDTPCLRRA